MQQNRIDRSDIADLVRKLLQTASHPSSPDGEALTAARKVRAVLERRGFGIDDIRVGPKNSGVHPQDEDLEHPTRDDMKARIEALETRVARYQQELDALKRETVLFVRRRARR